MKDWLIKMEEIHERMNRVTEKVLVDYPPQFSVIIGGAGDKTSTNTFDLRSLNSHLCYLCDTKNKQY